MQVSLFARAEIRFRPSGKKRPGFLIATGFQGGGIKVIETVMRAYAGALYLPSRGAEGLGDTSLDEARIMAARQSNSEVCCRSNGFRR